MSRAPELPVVQLSCFAAETWIETETGMVAVEDLRVDDLVATDSGAFDPFDWIGHRAVNCARHPRPNTACPVRVNADAFGPGDA
jgi:hypothetical protein